jgi:hypothetical protein
MIFYANQSSITTPLGVIRCTATIPDSVLVSAETNHITSTSLPRAIARSFPSQSVISFSSPAISTLTIFEIALPSVDG